MLNHISIHIPPVVKKLGPENMSSHAPNGFVSSFSQPFVAELLCVEIMNFKGAVVNMGRGVCTHKESVVVYQVLSPINMCENSDILLLSFTLDIEKVGWYNIEIPSVELELLWEFLDA